jgi:energy-coupling factor transporter ATP-binding protein EcfA2
VLVIERVIVKGYRCFTDLDFTPNAGLNILVGDNEAGKSTLLEALALALTGRVNGRWASEELNPFWFHRPTVLEYFAKRNEGVVAPPEIHIELYLSSDIDALHQLRGVHNSEHEDCPGVALRVIPSSEYTDEFREYLSLDPPAILPVEYYAVEWRDFADQPLIRRPKELATSFIDSRTIRSTSGVDYHTREMLSDNLDGKERAEISLAHRKSRQEITDTALKRVNQRLAAENADLHHNPVGLQMDQSARASWEGGVVPQVEEIPFAMAGQGQQAAIKLSLAMSRTAHATFVLIEEPENHLSPTSLRRLIARIGALSGDDQQLFVTTHSSFVLNRLGVDTLILLHNGSTAKLTELDATTVSYFRKLSGYDTLRLVLARKAALVEGPSDAILLERALMDATDTDPADAGVDIISMGGLTFRRALELCAKLDRQAIALQDNDGQSPDAIRSGLDAYLDGDKRMLLVSDPSRGKTLEPQMVAANGEAALRRALALPADADLAAWMSRNKTAAALRILDSIEHLNYPDYIVEAVERLG